MIGVSLSPRYVLDGELIQTEPRLLLEHLKDMGVESIELRDAKPGTDPRRVLDFARRVWDLGLLLTVHCRVNSLQSAVADVFDTLEAVLAQLRQDSLTVTVHPIDGDNAAVLRALSDYALDRGYPVQLALENNRKLPDGREGDCAALVLEAVEQADRPNVGICFDMGHYLYYRKKNFPQEPFALPPKGFLKRVIHTHIHGVKELRTHFPLGRFELPLEQLLQAMCVGYYGVYDLELSFGRFRELCPPEQALEESVAELQRVMPARARLYDRLRAGYDRDFLHASGILSQKQPGTRLALTQCASYLFNTEGFGWGMDVSFLNVLRRLTQSPRRAAELLKDMKLMILTHAHGDHFSKPTVRALAADPQRLWVLPEFLVAAVQEQGVQPDRMRIARPGQVLTVGPLQILPFEGRHFRPEGGGVPAMGYHITCGGSLRLVFPGDVRDYRLQGLPQLPPADYCFAHVWLGDGNEEAAEFPMAEDFARFMLCFSQENILLSHLYNWERRVGYMWDQRHAAILQQTIGRLSARTCVQIPRIGQILTL